MKQGANSSIREEICRVGKSLFDRGYVHATAGNISVSLDESQGGGYIITPTDACLGFLDPAKLAHIDASGTHLSGDRPSKTIALHSRIYAAICKTEPSVRCVIHTHSTHCVALTLQQPVTHFEVNHFKDLLPPITPYFVMKVGHVPVIPYCFPGSVQSATWVEQSIERYSQAGINIKAVMLERLGPNVWHASPAQAMAVLEELEETAKLFMLTPSASTPLTAQQLQELRDTFASQW